MSKQDELYKNGKEMAEWWIKKEITKYVSQMADDLRQDDDIIWNTKKVDKLLGGFMAVAFFAGYCHGDRGDTLERLKILELV